MRAFLPLALLAITACYSPRSAPPTSGPYDGHAVAWDAERPLEASVWYNEHTGHANFTVSHPANVAIFALRPGAGVEMIYPAFGAGRRTAFSSGTHYVRTGGSPYRMTGNWSMAYGQGPMYILLVASEGPINVGAFHATGAMSWLHRTSVTYSPYVTLEALVGEIVPNPQAGGWTTAMHVVWPDALDSFRSDRPRYMRVQCANGIVVVVPMEAWVAGYPVCPEHLPNSPPSDTVPRDSVRGIREALPNRPQPPQGWITASIGDTDLHQELRRLREENGKRDPGPLDLAPYPGSRRDGGLSRSFGHLAGSDDQARRGTRSRPPAARSRPADRPAAPAARPARDRPTPQARPRPTPPPRPVPEARPRPAPTPPPARPTPPPKPKPRGGNGGGNGGS